MSKFYLHQVYRDRRVTDHEGYVFTELDEAVEEAVLSARQIVGDALMQGALPDYGRIEIADASGRVLAEISFPEALGLSERGACVV